MSKTKKTMEMIMKDRRWEEDVKVGENDKNKS